MKSKTQTTEETLDMLMTMESRYRRIRLNFSLKEAEPTWENYQYIYDWIADQAVIPNPALEPPAPMMDFYGRPHIANDPVRYGREAFRLIDNPEDRSETVRLSETIPPATILTPRPDWFPNGVKIPVKVLERLRILERLDDYYLAAQEAPSRMGEFRRRYKNLYQDLLSDMQIPLLSSIEYWSEETNRWEKGVFSGYAPGKFYLQGIERPVEIVRPRMTYFVYTNTETETAIKNFENQTPLESLESSLNVLVEKEKELSQLKTAHETRYRESLSPLPRIPADHPVEVFDVLGEKPTRGHFAGWSEDADKPRPLIWIHGRTSYTSADSDLETRWEEFTEKFNFLVLTEEILNFKTGEKDDEQTRGTEK